MTTQNPKISVYIPLDVEKHLRESIKDWDKKDKNGKPAVNKSKIIVDILRSYFGIESSDSTLSTVNNRLVELEDNIKILEKRIDALTAICKDKIEVQPQLERSSSLPLLELIASSKETKTNQVNFKTATTKELLQLLEELEPEKDWDYEKLRRLRQKLSKLPFKVRDYEVAWLGKGSIAQSGQHLWKVVYLGKEPPVSMYEFMN